MQKRNSKTRGDPRTRAERADGSRFALTQAVEAVQFEVRVGERERLAVVLFDTLAECFGEDIDTVQWLSVCHRHRHHLHAAARRKAASCGQRLLILEPADILPADRH